MGRKSRLKQERRQQARRPRGPDEECPRCGWIHDGRTPCLDEKDLGPIVAAESFGACASNGVHEVHEILDVPVHEVRAAAHPRAHEGLLALATAPGPLDPLRLAEEVLRAGPDGLLPDGARVGDVFPELFQAR